MLDTADRAPVVWQVSPSSMMMFTAAEVSARRIRLSFCVATNRGLSPILERQDRQQGLAFGLNRGDKT